MPIFRFADIILTKAEAVKRGATATNGDTPQSLFNQIRSYVHAPLLDHDPSLQDKTCRILPVPDDILKENTNWEQNPGYNN